MKVNQCVIKVFAKRGSDGLGRKINLVRILMSGRFGGTGKRLHSAYNLIKDKVINIMESNKLGDIANNSGIVGLLLAVGQLLGWWG